MDIQHNAALASLTSLAVGGPAEKLYTCVTNEELQAALIETTETRPWLLSYGANVLISDAGLPGTTLLIRTHTIEREVGTNTIVADAGVWWDNLVQFAIGQGLWGLELTSAIPGGVGAAVAGNIAAYGQAVAGTLAWAEVYDQETRHIRRMLPAELGLSYRFSSFQTEAFKSLIILRAAFALSVTPQTEVVYQSVLDVASEQHHDLTTLAGRREAVLETRRRAGSIWDYHNPETQMHTAGSFFRNPMVDNDIAEKIMAYDETGKTKEMIKKMNLVHGGTQKRVSAAHVLLAAGFHRGQTWGAVRLHPDHILKIENTGGATAQNIYDVATEIIETVRTKLGIELIPEVRFLGKFK